ncbi:lipopolysaccharide-induced tumor necrosis factor-alpha factor homolog [Ostrea edulis]|uniref:lipopolysaccharide-induced tumor necrosis factor-alpha factor homolog n=1 Tax=Ostrea edulis TaxID=37623 RepID=UPI002095386D|nr:lipopolysaccharide-induced tumor necrosis factor-alpha factor homolog [Ostrea edulis]
MSHLQPPPQQQPQVITVQSATPAFRDIPVSMVCPHCNHQIQTAIAFESGTLTWVICGVLLLFGCWLGCCLIPFFIDGCKDCIHTCPSCNNVVGKFTRL